MLELREAAAAQAAMFQMGDDFSETEDDENPIE